MIFDTDVLIWAQRGNTRAADIIDAAEQRCISILTYMELLQTAPQKQQHKKIKDLLKNCDFEILALSENIGHRAAIYIEEYSMSDGLRANDALIAATAVDQNMMLVSGNKKHYYKIKELQLTVFKA